MKDEYASMLSDAIPMFGMGLMLLELVVFSGIGQPGLGLDFGIATWVISLFWPFFGFKVAELWANSDYLIRADMVDALGNRRSVHLWMDKSPLDNALATLTYLGGGISQVALNLKQNMPFLHWWPQPGGSEHYRIYIQFYGKWPERMPMLGCRANRYSFYELWIKRGDRVILWELPWSKGFPNVPAVEADQSIHPVFFIPPFAAPGDHQIWLDGLEAKIAGLEETPDTEHEELTLVVKP